MKQLINKFKKLNKTKKLVILFITISFAFIIGIGVYQSINNPTENSSTIVETDQKDNESDKDNKKDTSSNKSETTQKSENQTQEETTTAEDTNKKSTKKESTTNKDSTTTESNTQNQSTTENNNTEETKTETIQVTLTVKGMGNVMMSGQLQLEKNTSVYTALKTLANQKGIKISTSGYGSMIYVRGIGDLYEKQHGSSSGWMYQVNGVAPNVGSKNYTLSDGDTVLWYYVNYE